MLPIGTACGLGVNVSLPAADSPAEPQLHPAGCPLARGGQGPGWLLGGVSGQQAAPASPSTCVGGPILSFGKFLTQVSHSGELRQIPWAGNNAQGTSDPCVDPWALRAAEGKAFHLSVLHVNFYMSECHGQRIPPDFSFLHISTVHPFPSSMRSRKGVVEVGAQ